MVMMGKSQEMEDFLESNHQAGFAKPTSQTVYDMFSIYKKIYPTPAL
jgi:hypothetical protein